jgi:hypothetical protein
VKTDEKEGIVRKLNKLIHEINGEIHSHWPYPNKDRKRIKVEALRKIKIAIQRDKDVMACIMRIESDQPAALEGKLSTRTYDVIQLVKAWANCNTLNPSVSMRSMAAA